MHAHKGRYACMTVCSYTHLYALTHVGHLTSVQAHSHACMHLHPCPCVLTICLQALTHVCAHLKYMHTYICGSCVHTCLCALTHTHTPTCASTCAYPDVAVHTHVCMYAQEGSSCKPTCVGAQYPLGWNSQRCCGIGGGYSCSPPTPVETILCTGSQLACSCQPSSSLSHR